MYLAGSEVIAIFFTVLTQKDLENWIPKIKVFLISIQK